ncbi:opioid growth factor receptor-like [Pagrus major]|uniref:opioid growth factor receptor-like n=1 Tax=Pagrus major TaxID=143350 RepID=UPI003CC85091
MGTLSVLYGLGRHVVSLMAWYTPTRLYPLLQWLWDRFLILGRCVQLIFRPVISFIAALGWRKDGGRSIEEPVISDDEDEGPVKVFPEQVRPPGCEPGPGDSRGRAGASDGELTDDESEDEDDGKYRVETTDDLYCGYDSTWETEENQRSPPRGPNRRSAASRSYKFSRFESAAKDMQNYRHDYPNRPQRWTRPASDDKPNLNFYLGWKPSEPDGVYINTFHDEWTGNYDALEHVHTYIQWLFPLQEPGVNYEASPLTKEEIQGFLNNSSAKENLLKSYVLMLDFYGIKLCDEETGEVKKAHNWRERFNNLDTHTHNNLRITRILKCLGNLGYVHYQAPLVQFFLEETLVNGQLPNVKESVLNYFVFAVLDKKERRNLLKFAYSNYDRQDEFVWCPKKIQRIWSSQAQQGMKSF